MDTVLNLKTNLFAKKYEKATISLQFSPYQLFPCFYLQWRNDKVQVEKYKLQILKKFPHSVSHSKYVFPTHQKFQFRWLNHLFDQNG